MISYCPRTKKITTVKLQLILTCIMITKSFYDNLALFSKVKELSTYILDNSLSVSVSSSTDFVFIFHNIFLDCLLFNNFIQLVSFYFSLPFLRDAFIFSQFSQSIDTLFKILHPISIFCIYIPYFNFHFLLISQSSREKHMHTRYTGACQV